MGRPGWLVGGANRIVRVRAAGLGAKKVAIVEVSSNSVVRSLQDRLGMV
jgi:hypothetical protein